MTNSYSSQIAELLIRCEAVAFSTDPLFTYVTGIQSPVYTDNRRLLGYPNERAQVIDSLIELAKTTFKTQFDAIAGTATAGIPWAAWIAERLELPMLYVRSEAKGHGKGKACEGYAPEGANVLLVEDLFTTGSSAKTSVEHLRNEGFKCDSCVGITTYGKPQVEKTFADLGVQAVTLTNVDETLKQAQSLGKLSDDQIKVVENWISEQRS